ncbi:MAG: single-stranded-DNA-specific exonuclease RecJ, partial [Thermomicrobiales bacterium]
LSTYGGVSCMHLPQSPRPITWIDPAPIPTTVELDSLHPNPVISRLLYRRGIRDHQSATAFLSHRPQAAPDPYMLPNLRAAVERVSQAIDNGERIGIFGDYDVDGVTSTALLVLALRAATDRERISSYLPDRTQGYGLNLAGIDELHGNGATLLITVDCGSNDQEQVAYAQSRGMDVIILDHHRISGDTPVGALTVSPQLLPSPCSYHDLTGVGVAYLLISTLAQHGYPVEEREDAQETSFLDLVALGTVADVAPLHGINRCLVRDGLAVLSATSRPGLKALMRNASVTPQMVTATDISFGLAPRMNAPGRMSSPQLAFDLLLSESVQEAEQLAQALEVVNTRRQAQTEVVIGEAHAMIARLPNWQERPLIALERPTWPAGLLGAVASRLQEELHRPIFLFRNDDGILHGSARSVPGFDLVNALGEVDSLLIRYGEHSQAAGITLEDVQLDHLRDAFAEMIEDQGLEIPLPPSIVLDEVLTGSDVTPDLVRSMHAMEPFGSGNPSPMFRIDNARVLRYSTMGKDNTHLRITLQVGQRQVTAVQWSAAHRSRELVEGRQLDVAGHLELNSWQGQERLQIMLKDFRVS